MRAEIRLSAHRSCAGDGRQGQPIANIAVIYRDDQGKVQHLVMNHRPLPAVLLFSRLMGEQFRGTAYAEFFATPE
ncbi:hypothetical protein AB0C04_20325 [Micromonospora sp. NPDC048909]|uniref:hypothetical protein n=1 Tax=Micromonospora sp. NPDC048909 TaxID=3155643 RepID=UPI0033F08AAB